MERIEEYGFYKKHQRIKAKYEGIQPQELRLHEMKYARYIRINKFFWIGIPALLCIAYQLLINWLPMNVDLPTSVVVAQWSGIGVIVFVVCCLACLLGIFNKHNYELIIIRSMIKEMNR